MASDRFDELITQLETITPKYGRLATELSVSIARIEQRLASLEGKTACDVIQGDVRLRFARSGDKWTLLTRVRVPGSLGAERPLRSAPVEVKIKAVELIEPLLTTMLGVQRERLNQLEHAATIGSDLAKRLDSNPKEGDE